MNALARKAAMIHQPDDALSVTFARNVIRLRNQRQLTQIDLSARAGLTQAAVARIETGECNPRLSTIECLANAFEVGVDELLVKPK